MRAYLMIAADPRQCSFAKLASAKGKKDLGFLVSAICRSAKSGKIQAEGMSSTDISRQCPSNELISRRIVGRGEKI